MNKRIKPKIIITKLPRWTNFQWFLLGFYKLQENAEISLSFRAGFLVWLSLLSDSRLFLGICRKIFRGKDSYNLEGYIRVGGLKKYFCIDCADTPYLFDSKLLDKVDVYFKMQCPVNFDPDGFSLTDSVKIPWCDHRHTGNSLASLTARGERSKCHNFIENIYKIKPLMVGPRRLAYGNSYRDLERAYQSNLLASQNMTKGRLMCYFGNALGPRPSVHVDKPDYDCEADIMAWFGKAVNHPNEKRAMAAAIIADFGPEYDARVINDWHSDSMRGACHKELIIPLETFCNHISRFEYNLNISGYRMSIPNRFIESFIVGTAILTDKLKVKWYLPFENEVRETVSMGYLPEGKVDWEQFRKDISVLPKTGKQEVLKAFSEKWAPEVVARYIIETMCM